LPVGRFETVRLNPDRDIGRCEILPAHLLGRARRVDRNRFLQFVPGLDRPAERARSDQAFAGGCHLLEIEAGDAPQLEHHALEDDAEAFVDQFRIRIAQFERRGDADRAEALIQPLGDAPKIGQFRPRERVGLRFLTEQETDPARRRRFLRGAVGDLGERLRWGYADRNRNPRPLLDGAAQLAGMGFKTSVETCEAQERFVDRVDFMPSTSAVCTNRASKGASVVPRDYGVSHSPVNPAEIQTDPLRACECFALILFCM
jgi:hypothetical protein